MASGCLGLRGVESFRFGTIVALNPKAHLAGDEACMAELQAADPAPWSSTLKH